MSRINRITLLVAICVFTFIAAWSGWTLLQGRDAITSSGKALVGGPFELLRQDGKPFTDKELQGKFSLIFFGYTYCPDVCPAGLQVISAALDKLGDTADRILPVFITIDPERDTPEVMADYISHFHPRMVGLTGTADQVAKAAKAYRVYYQKAGDDDGGDDYLMDHSSIIYLMGPDGDFVKHFTYTTDVDGLAEAIAKAIDAR